MHGSNVLKLALLGWAVLMAGIGYGDAAEIMRCAQLPYAPPGCAAAAQGSLALIMGAAVGIPMLVLAAWRLTRLRAPSEPVRTIQGKRLR